MWKYLISEASQEKGGELCASWVEKEEGTVNVSANEHSPALPSEVNTRLSWVLQSDNPPQAAGCLLRVSKCLIIQDPWAGWPLPTSLACLLPLPPSHPVGTVFQLQLLPTALKDTKHF